MVCRVLTVLNVSFSDQNYAVLRVTNFCVFPLFLVFLLEAMPEPESGSAKEFKAVGLVPLPRSSLEILPAAPDLGVEPPHKWQQTLLAQGEL